MAGPFLEVHDTVSRSSIVAWRDRLCATCRFGGLEVTLVHLVVRVNRRVRFDLAVASGVLFGEEGPTDLIDAYEDCPPGGPYVGQSVLTLIPRDLAKAPIIDVRFHYEVNRPVIDALEELVP